jgi:hypothetical protein
VTGPTWTAPTSGLWHLAVGPDGIDATLLEPAPDPAVVTLSAEQVAELRRLATADYADEWDQAELYDRLAAAVLVAIGRDGPSCTTTDSPTAR